MQLLTWQPQSRFMGPGVLQTPGDRLQTCCQACQRVYARGVKVPVVGEPLMALTATLVIANAAAYGLALGLKGAGCGWLVGDLAARTIYSQYSTFLQLCDTLHHWRFLPAIWVRLRLCTLQDLNLSCSPAALFSIFWIRQSGVPSLRADELTYEFFAADMEA